MFQTLIRRTLTDSATISTESLTSCSSSTPACPLTNIDSPDAPLVAPVATSNFNPPPQTPTSTTVNANHNSQKSPKYRQSPSHTHHLHTLPQHLVSSVTFLLPLLLLSIVEAEADSSGPVDGVERMNRAAREPRRRKPSPRRGFYRLNPCNNSSSSREERLIRSVINML